LWWVGCFIQGVPPTDFADFVQRRSGALLRAAWLLTSGDWALAEDLAQTALGEVWRSWDRVAGMDAPDAYAHKVLGSGASGHLPGREFTPHHPG
jgi:hypothetical protein